MNTNDTKLLNAIHDLDKKITKLETKIDENMTVRFQDNERRIHNLETNQRWVVLAIVGAALASFMGLILK